MEMGGSRLTGHAHHQLHLPPEGGQESPKRGVPGADGGKKKELLSHRQQRESPGLRERRLPAWGTHLSRHCLPGGGRGDKNAS